MLAAFPLAAGIALVAAQALTGAGCVVGYRISTLFENNIRRSTPFDIWVAVQVLFAFTVAALTGWRAGVTFNTVLGLVDGKNRRRLALVVAACTDRIFFQ